MRLGLYGGTFDPIHLGHLLLAETCRQDLQLDRVIFLPAGLPPHKQGQSLTPGKHRTEMLQLALAGVPEFTVDDREVRRVGPSYTVETLREYAQEYPESELYFLMGEDSLADFAQWYQPREIADRATLVTVNRGDRPVTPLDSLQPLIGDTLVQKFRRVAMPAVDLSASQMRQRIAEGRSIRFWTPRAVECYIVQHGLYRSETIG